MINKMNSMKLIFVYIEDNYKCMATFLYHSSSLIKSFVPSACKRMYDFTYAYAS